MPDVTFSTMRDGMCKFKLKVNISVLPPLLTGRQQMCNHMMELLCLYSK